jgi:hypothetical protein
MGAANTAKEFMNFLSKTCRNQKRLHILTPKVRNVLEYFAL